MYPQYLFQKFACSQASPSTQESLNSLVLSELKKLAETYRAKGDQWRAHGYEKAVSAIRRYGKEITCYEVSWLNLQQFPRVQI